MERGQEGGRGREGEREREKKKKRGKERERERERDGGSDMDEFSFAFVLSAQSRVCVTLPSGGASSPPYDIGIGTGHTIIALPTEQQPNPRHIKRKTGVGSTLTLRKNGVVQ